LWLLPIFIWNRLPVGAVAIFTLLILFATGVLTVNEALAGFGDPVVLFIAALFVASEGIDAGGVTTAAEAQVSPQPILMMIAVVGSAAFLTPIATPANMMVMGPAGYRFGDYWRLGLPVIGFWAIVALGLVPLIWPF
jgi:di/tricarboxylate transporter